MASTALEEKINKIRLRNEEIKRRYEEVEADKKNAAKLDALVEPVPLEDWPERKEPPEFSAPAPKHTNKVKHVTRKHNDQPAQYYTGSGDGKKAHNFGDGQGPPPDPKYNFLADSEREEHAEEIPRDTERNRGRNKPTRGIFKRRGSDRDSHTKEQWNQHSSPGDLTRPDYEAWRAERNRIDEARISRQRTAEGNWRREWDNDKVHLADAISKRDNRVTLGDVVTRQEHSDNDKLYRAPRTIARNPQYSNARESHHGSAVLDANKGHGSINEPEKRVVIATDRSIKVMLNPGSTPPKSSVMSVKVSPASIAGTGRVGPRQRPRVMYSSQSDAEISTHEKPTFTRQKSADEKTKSRPFEQSPKAISPKSPHPQRKRDSDPKSPYPQKKDNDRSDKYDGASKSGKKDSQKSPYSQRRGNGSGNYPPKSPRVQRRSNEGVKNDFAKSPRAQQERNREKYNQLAEETKRKSSHGDDVLFLGNVATANTNDKSNELLTHIDSNDKKIENVPIKQSSSEKSTNSAEVLGSDRNYLTDNSMKNDSETLEECSDESPVKPAEAILQSTENETTKQSSPETADSAILDSNKTVTPDKITITDSESLEEAVLQFVGNSANETIKQCPEISANASEPELEHEDENCATDNGKKNDAAILEEASLEAPKSSSSAENNTLIKTKDICEEASGSREPNRTLADDIDAGSASNRAVINCSANSELNDSGFTELPSNDSIHDISAGVNAETSDFAETSVDSMKSGSEVVEDRPIIENLEARVANAEVENIAEPSCSNLEKTADNSGSNALEEASQATDPANVLSTQQASDVVKTTNSTQEIDDNLQNFNNDTTKSEELEKDSATSLIVHNETDDNAVLTENSNFMSESKLKSHEENILKSVSQEAENVSITLLSEEKASEIAEKVTEAVNDAEKSSIDSEILSENSNKLENEITDKVNEKLKDCTINESGVSKSLNDIKKENAIAETVSSSVIEKTEADNQPN